MGLLESFNVHLEVPKLRPSDMKEVKLVLCQWSIWPLVLCNTLSIILSQTLNCLSRRMSLIVLFLFVSSSFVSCFSCLILCCRFLKPNNSLILVTSKLLWKLLVQRFVLSIFRACSLYQGEWKFQHVTRTAAFEVFFNSVICKPMYSRTYSEINFEFFWHCCGTRRCQSRDYWCWLRWLYKARRAKMQLRYARGIKRLISTTFTIACATLNLLLNTRMLVVCAEECSFVTGIAL